MAKRTKDMCRQVAVRSMFLLLLGEALPAASFLDDSVCTFATQEADGAVIRLSSKIALCVCIFFSLV